MASTRMETVLAMVLLTTLCVGAMAQSSCTTALVSLSPCLNYMTGNSSSPSSSCCSQLANVVGSQPQCLCSVLNGGGSSLGINVNQTQALALPGACNVQTPPVSRCNSGGAPTGSPASNTPASPSTPSTPSVPSIPSACFKSESLSLISVSAGGSKNVPTTGVDSSDASPTKLSLSTLVSLLFFASFAAPSLIKY
ncbi:non-specific lipid transfer protein GPI-anchored 5-like [Aristolochia californica]|uniref:non-specific lipid transfer protein GPI-anchored 5-like n=1 Tax=Aristolochia californica TaxID=171875 RepID=UPI0035D9D16F